MKNFKRRLLITFLAASLLSACAPSSQTVSDPQALAATIAAATIAARPTNTAYPSASPTSASARTVHIETTAPTLLPSLTPWPSTTAFPTLPQPSTLASVPVTGGSYILYTATPEPWKCELRHISPDQMTVFKPRYGFRTEWRIFNIGGKIWRSDSVRVKYLGGTALQNDPESKNEFFLPISIYPGDKILVQIAMTSPKEPGEYSSFWGLADEKDRIFCTFDITIRVK
ncbi:MAG: hypothetical protein Fur0035_06550 [Anaerolineales bacterium]